MITLEQRSETIAALRTAIAAAKEKAETDEELAAARLAFARGIVAAYLDGPTPEPSELDAGLKALASVCPVLGEAERDALVTRISKAWKVSKPTVRASLTKAPAKVAKASPEPDTETTSPEAKQDSLPEWLKSLQVRKDGTLRPNQHNLETILRNDEEAPQVHFDLLEQTVAWSSAPPWADSYDGCTTTKGAPWSNEDTTRLSSWLSREFRLDAAPDAIERALDVRAREREIDSWKDHLESLVWDGVPRLATAGETYYRATNGAAANLAYSYWIQQIAARTYRPGCKAHGVLVLHGGQGTYKSTSLEVLVGKKRFSDCELDLESKEVSSNLSGKIIHEFGEGTVLTRKDANSIKAFVSRDVERFTPKFKSKAVEVPRRTIFALTTNEDEILSDATGNRRFWVVEVGDLASEDVTKLERDAPQLLAEAVALFKSGQRWWPETDEEKALLAEAADAQRKRSPWEAEIAEGLSNKNETTIEEVISTILGLSSRDVQQRNRLEVMGCLKALGWVRSSGQKRINGRLTRYYERKEKIVVKPPPAELTSEEVEEIFRGGFPANTTETPPPPSGVVEVPAEPEFTIEVLRGATWSMAPDGSVQVVGTIGQVSVLLTIAAEHVDDMLGHLGVSPIDEPLPPGDVEVEVRPNGLGGKGVSGFLRLVS